MATFPRSQLPPELDDIPLDTDIEAVAALLEKPRPSPKFAFGENRFHIFRAKSALAAQRRGIRSLIRPENARAVVVHLPTDAGERTHCLLRGDFVLCDLIPAILELHGPCPHLRVATLGLSIANADTLTRLVEDGVVGRLTLVVSYYFQQVDKTTVFRAVAAKLATLGERQRLVITRSHAKVICLPTTDGGRYVIEGSANLRSSDNVEQMLIVNDSETHDFHASWIDELATA